MIGYIESRQEVAPVSQDESYPEIRQSVRALCADFPGPYWRERDRERAYPEEFVDTLVKEGWLAALIPEEFGGSGLGLPTVHRIVEEHGGSIRIERGSPPWSTAVRIRLPGPEAEA